MTTDTGDHRMTAKQAVQEQRLDQHDKHLDRIDGSIEKLTEVSISLKEIVRNHDSALAANVDDKRQIYKQIDDNRKESDFKFSELKDHVDDVEKNIRAEITSLSLSLTNSIQAVSDALSTKTGVFDKYKWLIMGGVGVLMFLSDKIPFIERLFGG